jgi:3-hydroxyisobutyrate dehydrogenase-like beta-hydroxyacid dehydrogenase
VPSLASPPGVNHGTGDPTENEHIGAFLAESGIKYLDAPVSGGRPGAVARTLTTLVGGDANDFARCREVFETFSRKVAHMGGVGSGQLTKLLNNAMTMTNLKNAVDVFGLAKNLGIDTRRLFDVIAVSSGSSAVLQSVGSQINSKTAVHIQGLMRKDIEHFADAMRARGLDPSSSEPLCRAHDKAAAVSIENGEGGRGGRYPVSRLRKGRGATVAVRLAKAHAVRFARRRRSLGDSTLQRMSTTALESRACRCCARPAPRQESPSGASLTRK